jgi:chorismate mutase/prephenate dehydrogenase
MKWSEDWRGELTSLRDEINRVDKGILNLIRERMDICKSVGEIKHHIGKPIFDPVREREVIEDRVKTGRDLNLSDDFVRMLLDLLMEYSKRIQAAEIHKADYQLV